MRRLLPALLLLLLPASAPRTADASAAPKPAGDPLRASSGLLVCTSAVPISCGDVVQGSNGTGSSVVSSYSCGGGETGPEVVYAITLEAPMTVQISLVPEGCDLDLFVLGSCDEQDCIASSAGVSTENVTVPLGAGTSYIVVDGYAGAVCNYTLLVSGCTDSPEFRSELVGFGGAPLVSTPWYLGFQEDAAGNPHILYQDASFNLLHAFRSGGAWSVEPVDTTATATAFSPDLAIDGLGTLHTAYLVEIAGVRFIRYARNSGGSWQVETLARPASKASFIPPAPSIDVTAAGQPHIAFADSGEALYHATKASGAWTLTRVETDATYSISLELDPLGRPCVAYQAYDGVAGSDLYFARGYGQNWQTETVDGGGSTLSFGSYCSLAIDATGAPHIAYLDPNYWPTYSRQSGSAWSHETITPQASFGYTSIAVEADGTPHVMYNNVILALTPTIDYARRTGGLWSSRVAAASVMPGGGAVFAPTLRLDASGAPRMAYLDTWGETVWYAIAAAAPFAVNSPAPGATWPVGSLQTVSWAGGLEESFDTSFDVQLSVDGGHTYDTIVSGVSGESATFRVPHAPTRYARIKVQRTLPFEEAITDSFFTIDASILLTSFQARRAEDGDITVTWSTQPGPEADISYRVERREGAGRFVPLHAGRLTRGEIEDPAAPADAAYRVIAVNGLGAEYVLGDAAPEGAGGPSALTAHPLPYRGGDLAITFATAGGLGGGPAPARVDVFDVSGRRVRSVFEGKLEAGHHATVWDGRADSGRNVSPGIYFLRAVSGTAPATVKKITVVR